MLNRIHKALSWQRLIGVASGVFGAAATAAFVAQLSTAGSLRGTTLYKVPELVASICGCVFLLLAFPLYTGREWARRALLVTAYCILGALAIFCSFAVFRDSAPASAAAYPKSVRVVMELCTLVSILTPPAFLLGVLHHADVRRAFQAKKASNQSLEPTVDQPDSSL
jgi:hypothetical protein